MKITQILIVLIATISINSTLFTRLRDDLYSPYHFGAERQIGMYQEPDFSGSRYMEPQYQHLRYRGSQGYPRAYQSHNNVARYNFNRYTYNMPYAW